MNIFVLSENPFEAARYHCDRHTCKMVIEYAQLLSTAHRYHDGERTLVELPNGRSKPLLLLPGETYAVVQVPPTGSYKAVINNPVCYRATHINHPSAIWARETDANYHWLFQLFDGCLREYASRYGKTHATSRLFNFLSLAPKHIRRIQLTPFAQAMPEEYKHDDPVEAYRRFYLGPKARFAKWNHSPAPSWFVNRLERQNATHLSGAFQLD